MIVVSLAAAVSAELLAFVAEVAAAAAEPAAAVAFVDAVDAEPDEEAAEDAAVEYDAAASVAFFVTSVTFVEICQAV